MFYTKYRPQKFSEIEKTTTSIDALITQIKNNKTVHAYLFVGPRGTGKTTTARILAKALNCEKVDSKGDPCGKCPNCLSISSGTFVDLVEIDAASNRGIDDIRELKERIKLTPSAGKFKVYIVDEVHMLSADAFNAFLKTLEEPPRNTVFILCTTELHKVPDTVKSRCQIMKFKRATLEQLVAKLTRILKSEGKKVEPALLTKVALASYGGFRDAETLLQQIVEGEVDPDSAFSFGGRDKIVEFTEMLISCDIKSSLEFSRKVFEEGIDLTVWLGEIVHHLRDLIYLKSGASIDDTGLTPELMDQILSQRDLCSFDWLVGASKRLTEAQKDVKNSFVSQLPIEVAIVELCTGLSMSPQSVQPKSPLVDGTGPVGTSLGSKPKTDSGSKTKPEPSKTSGNTPVLETKVVKHEKKEITVEIVSEVSVEDTNLKTESDNKTQKPSLNMTFDELICIWPELVAKISAKNSSIGALIRTGKPREIDGSCVVLEVAYAFHKERIESSKNRKLIADCARELLSKELGVKCFLNSSLAKTNMNLTDMNVVPASVDSSAAVNIVEMFDGGLPLI